MSCNNKNDDDGELYVGEVLAVEGWGPSDVVKKLQYPARFLAIGSQSEVDSVVVEVDGVGEVVVSVGAPLVDLPLRRGTIVKPHTPNPIPSQEWIGPENVARLELLAMPVVPRGPWASRRAPREYYELVTVPGGALSDPEDEESERVAGLEVFALTYPVRGAGTLTASLRPASLHGGPLEYRVVAHRVPGSITSPVSPETLGDWLPVPTTGDTWHLPVDVDEVDFVHVLVRQPAGGGGGPLNIHASGIVRDRP